MNNIGWIISVALSGIVVFTSTNIDDLFLLMLLFSRLDMSFNKQQIVVGQYLGFIVIIAVSTLGFLGRFFVHVPLEWIGFLGLIPVVMGINGVRKLFWRQKITSGVYSKEGNYLSLGRKRTFTYKLFAPLFNLRTYSVAAMTIGNGTDNIGAYIPLFAKGNLINLSIIIGLFLLLIGAWCYIAYVVVHLPAVARAVDRYGHLLLPFLFLFVGIFVMNESGTLRLLFSFVMLR